MGFLDADGNNWFYVSGVGWDPKVYFRTNFDSLPTVEDSEESLVQFGYDESLVVQMRALFVADDEPFID